MKSVGIVKSVQNDIAEIRAATADECAHCPLQGSCPSSLSDNGGTVLAWNNVGAEVGDMVEFEYEERDIIKGIFTIYMIPFFFFIAGLILGLILEKGFNIHLGKLENLLSVLTSVLFLLFGVLYVREKDKNFRIPSKIVSVIAKGSYLDNLSLNLNDKH